MSKKPERFSINKRIGQQNVTRDLRGRLVERAEFVFVMSGEMIDAVKTVYDPDHFIYQNLMPITESEVRIKYMGVLPSHLRGSHIMCTCGSEAVVMMEGPYAGMALCRSVATVEKHQTSFQVKDRKILYDKKTQESHFMGDSDIAKTMKSEEQTKDENSDDLKNEED